MWIIKILCKKMLNEKNNKKNYKFIYNNVKNYWKNFIFSLNFKKCAKIKKNKKNTL